MTLQDLNKIIERFEKAFSADKWFQIDHFKVLYDELLEKRDAALKAKEALEAPIIAQELINEDDSVNPRDYKEREAEMIQDGKDLVATHFPE